MGKGTKETTSNPHGRGRWYFTTTTSCVLCGRTKVDRERRRDKKPKDYEERYEYREDACGDHFV